jgi:hypothetical protein
MDKTLSEKEIDEIVETQGNDESAWGKPKHVRRRGNVTPEGFKFQSVDWRLKKRFKSGRPPNRKS